MAIYNTDFSKWLMARPIQLGFQDVQTLAAFYSLESQGAGLQMQRSTSKYKYEQDVVIDLQSIQDEVD